jgi:hypothetical protein
MSDKHDDGGLGCCVFILAAIVCLIAWLTALRFEKIESRVDKLEHSQKP